ncbi:beta-mannosidase [Actinoplanes campanulatus]|uniref:beta-mannosidase n=1 Tax=Actinoplanes campanulatus TaxID=113559 RepID=A0A7W5FJD5_9ACTN|nr:glycoside hydrolase family 2 protein [Actinoplanes campanulatus]MBB3100658.1 beta-mannosidase [Actinoplanes campanulatus]GGN45629.1 beta-mannosidase [Actinoplanes campanulatus]GID41118.1 beta-mannosidase [Actinoplanes campanulatus]
MLKTDLHQGWTVRSAGGRVPSEIAASRLPTAVPGTVHTDLLTAGLIADPYLGANEAGLAWFHRSAWLYETTFTAAPAAPGERVDLVFDGLDTVATVEVDGTEVGRTANMHRGYRFDVRHLLRDGEIPLSVRFDSALEHAERFEEQAGSRPRPYPHPFNAVRKMACSFGWDWGPDLQTAGIWKPVRLERWHTARFASVRPSATRDRLTVHVAVERASEAPLTVEVRAAGRTARVDVVAGRATVELHVPDAPVWWPVGLGEQPLVPVEVTLVTGDHVLDEHRARVGFRDVRLDESPDEHGSRFTLIVNDREVFVLGLNWIPEDHLLTRITRERLEAAVGRAVAGNANLLRVWGGGIWESDEFYDVCDELGVLVWQDFPLACAAYSEEEPMRSEILAEARENVTRLAPHPSLILWNGGNENIWGHEDWQWKEALNGATWGARYYYEDFPALLAELDPTRPYHPGSPSSPGHDPEVVHPNDDRFGTRHEWEAWNREDYRVHDNFVPRFCSEFGWQAPPAWSTLTATLAPEDLRKDSAAFLLHQKAEDGNGKLDRGLAHHMAVPSDFAAWHWATQLNQARATAYAVAHLRGHAPRTMGSILWQLNDCWPVTSWAVVDGSGRLKPAWYALRRTYAPVLLSFQERDGRTVLAVINDRDEPWRDSARLRRVRFDGAELAAVTAQVDVPARSVGLIEVDPGLLAAAEPDREVLVADSGGLRATHLFAEDFDLRYDPAAVRAHAVAVEGGYSITVTAASFARDVAVLADRVAPDAVVDDMLVDLLPGETHTFTVTTAATVDGEAFAAPEVLRSANALAAPAQVG